jgi:hypothetical protein
MRSKILLGLVLMMFVAVPAMAVPVGISVSGGALGTVVTLDAFGNVLSVAADNMDIAYTISMTADSAALVVDPVFGSYYDNLVATISFAGTFETIDPVTGLAVITPVNQVNVGIAELLYASDFFSIGYAPLLTGTGDAIIVPGPMNMVASNAIYTETYNYTNVAFTLASGLYVGNTMIFEAAPIIGFKWDPNFPQNPNPEPIYELIVAKVIVPEPSIFMLFGAGLLGLGLLRKKM